MNTYDWPADLGIESMDWGIDRAVVRMTSGITRAVQSVDLLGYQWVVQVSMPPKVFGDAGKQEAFFNTLVGGVDRVKIYRRDRPVPRGTLRGAPTIGAPVAQLSDTLVLADAWDLSRQNLLVRSQEFDNASWAKTALAVSANAATAPDGTATADLLTVSASAAGSRATQAVTAVAAGSHSLSFHLKAGTANTARLLILNQTTATTIASALINVSTGASSLLVGESAAGEVVAGGWIRGRVTCLAASVSAGDTLVAYVYPNNSSNTAGDSVYAWGVQLERGSVATEYIQTTSVAAYPTVTLKAGDMLGIAPQLFQVRENAVSDTVGQMTVKLVNRTRTSFVAGTPVVWDRPTATFVMDGSESAFTFSKLHMAGSTFKFIEAR